MSGSVARECIRRTPMQEITCLPQLQPACLKCCFGVNLKLTTEKLKVSFWYFRNFYQSVNSLSVIWLGPFQRKGSHLTLLFQLMPNCMSWLVHFLVFLFFKYGPSAEEGDVILLSFLSVPVLEFAITGLKGQRACFLSDEEGIMTGILVLSGDS